MNGTILPGHILFGDKRPPLESLWDGYRYLLIMVSIPYSVFLGFLMMALVRINCRPLCHTLDSGALADTCTFMPWFLMQSIDFLDGSIFVLVTAALWLVVIASIAYTSLWRFWWFRWPMAIITSGGFIILAAAIVLPGLAGLFSDD